jgi:hypothetical protein
MVFFRMTCATASKGLTIVMLVSDTAPGYTKHSKHFAVTFITGEQCGMNSAVIEWQTDWHDIMSIILAGLETHPDHVAEAASVMAADLDTWAVAQPGGSQLRLRITVAISEGRYFLPPLGRRKELRIAFNDRFRTKVLFHIVKKPVRVESLRRLATIAVADHLPIPECASSMSSAAAVAALELPRNLAAEVRTALHFSWTVRQFWRGVGRCRAWCPCQLGTRHFSADSDHPDGGGEARGGGQVTKNGATRSHRSSKSKKPLKTYSKSIGKCRYKLRSRS